MKRKVIVLFTAMMLLVSMGTMKLFAYSTTSTQYIGDVVGTADGQTAYGNLQPGGGVAKLQIRDINGTVLASEVYPVYPPNGNDVETSCPKGSKRIFRVVSVDGNQIWGSANYGLR